jgi:hypothetical protein
VGQSVALAIGRGALTITLAATGNKLTVATSDGDREVGQRTDGKEERANARTRLLRMRDVGGLGAALVLSVPLSFVRASRVRNCEPRTLTRCGEHRPRSG